MPLKNVCGAPPKPATAPPHSEKLRSENIPAERQSPELSPKLQGIVDKAFEKAEHRKKLQEELDYELSEAAAKEIEESVRLRVQRE